MSLAGTRLMILVPSRGEPHPMFVASLARIVAALVGAGHDVAYETVVGAPRAYARNELARRFLRSGREAALCLDDDVEAPAEVVLRMLALDLELVAAAYPERWTTDWFFTGAVLGVEGETLATEQCQVGCALVRRAALERMVGHPSALAPRDHGDGRWGFFDDPLGRELPDAPDEDADFCLRYRACGGQPRVLVDADMTHWESNPRDGRPEKFYRGNIRDHLGALLHDFLAARLAALGAPAAKAAE